MKIEYRKQDLLQTHCKHILHGCNARGKMGAGVAAAIRKKWPNSYTDYINQYNSYGLQLGSFIPSIQADGVTIYHGIVQLDYGRDPTRVYVSYWAIANILKMLDGKNARTCNAKTRCRFSRR
jgi:hypothetical protein